MTEIQGTSTLLSYQIDKNSINIVLNVDLGILALFFFLLLFLFGFSSCIYLYHVFLS